MISRATYIRFSPLTGSPQSMTMAWEWEKPPPHEMKTSHLQWQVWSTHGLVSTTSGVVPSKEDQTLGGACVLKKADLLLLQLTSASVSRGNKSSCHCLVPLSHSIYPMILLFGRKSQKSGSPHWGYSEHSRNLQESVTPWPKRVRPIHKEAKNRKWTNNNSSKKPTSQRLLNFTG